MTRKTDSHLGDSWVVNDADSDSSYKDEVSGEELVTDVPSNNLRHQKSKTLHSKQANTRKHSESPVKPPDLIMPSLESPQRRSRASTPSAAGSKMRYSTAVSTAKQAPAQSKVHQRKVPSQRDYQKLASDSDEQSNWFDTAMLYLTPILKWLYDILGITFQQLKTPISWLLIVYLIAGLLTLASNLLTSSVYTALSPICRIPGVSFLSLPICTYHSPHHAADPTQPTISSGSESAPDPEFTALIKTQNQFESILSSTESSLSLPLSMKRTETSIRDLRSIVRFSSLQSRNELVLEFDNFITNAREASYNLQRFNSHVGGAVDKVLSTARWTQRVLDDLSVQQSQHGPGYLPSLFSAMLSPFQPITFTHSTLLDTYITHTHTLTTEIASLLEEAQALLLTLTGLEDNLEVIHSISLRDNISAQGNKDEILTHLWTILGGNRALLKKYNKQLLLLREVGDYRRLAFEHVSAVILQLQSMGAELEELRSRVGAAELQRDYGGKTKERVPLQVHLEAIRLGVERLEVAREGERGRERAWIRGQLGDEKRVEGKDAVIGIEG